MLTRFKVNQIIFLSSFSCLIFLAYFVISGINFVWLPFVFLLVIFLMHYQYNLIHIGSHNQISKNQKLNSFIGNLAAIIGGTTFATFTSTHLEHHKNPSIKGKDPDEWITSNTNFLLIPFKIFYQDYFFWNSGLWKKRGYWKGYVLNRSIQAIILTLVIISGNFTIWLILWTIPVYIVGYLNGIFLFFVPHYTTRRMEKWKSLKKPNLWQKFCISIVYMSLHYHLNHHKKISENRNYFPVLAYFQDNKFSLKSDSKLLNETL
jgi:fatty acid desaturase